MNSVLEVDSCLVDLPAFFFSFPDCVGQLFQATPRLMHKIFPYLQLRNSFGPPSQFTSSPTLNLGRFFIHK